MIYQDDCSLKIRKVVPCSPDISPPLLCPDLQPVRIEHQNPWFKVLSRGTYFTLEYERPQVAILPIVDTGAILMVRVKRPLISDAPLELPAGESLSGETPRQAASREFHEETGIHIADNARFKPELPFSEMPGRMPVLHSIFSIELSKNEWEYRGNHDEEIASIEIISFSEVRRKLLSGEIYLCSPCAVISRFLLAQSCLRS